jgi:AraC-like DNA-binding protein
MSVRERTGFIPTNPMVGEAGNWENFRRLIERQLLPSLDAYGAPLFLPTPQPLPPDARIPLIDGMLSSPWQNPYPLFVYVADGVCLMMLKGQWLQVPAGKGVFVPAHTPYVAHAALGDRLVPCDLLNFSVFSFGVLVHRCRLTPHEHLKSVHYAVLNPALWDLCCLWANILSASGGKPTLGAKGLLLAFFSLLTQGQALPFQAQMDDLLPPQWATLPLPLQRAIKWLHHAFERPFHLPRLAQYCGVSPAYLCRLFRRHLGMTPIGYLTHLRLHLARRLVETTELSLADIAFLVGYRQLTYFVRQFRRLFGQSPGRLRERRRPRRAIPVAPPLR